MTTTQLPGSRRCCDDGWNPPKYARVIHRHTNYRPTWLPGVPVALGDVGTIKDGSFTRVTSLDRLGIRYEVISDEVPNDITNFESTGVGSVEFKGKGETNPRFTKVAKAKAGARVEFTGADAIVMRTKNARFHRIADLVELERQIVQRVRALDGDGEPSWRRSWVVVTEVVDAESTTILMSNEAGSEVEIEASGTIGPDGLADAEAGLTSIHEREVGVKTIARSGMTPLYRAHRIRRLWWWLWEDLVPAGNVPPEEGDELIEEDVEDLTESDD